MALSLCLPEGGEGRGRISRPGQGFPLPLLGGAISHPRPLAGRERSQVLPRRPSRPAASELLPLPLSPCPRRGSESCACGRRRAVTSVRRAQAFPLPYVLAGSRVSAADGGARPPRGGDRAGPGLSRRRGAARPARAARPIAVAALRAQPAQPARLGCPPGRRRRRRLTPCCRPSAGPGRRGCCAAQGRARPASAGSRRLTRLEMAGGLGGPAGGCAENAALTRGSLHLSGGARVPQSEELFPGRAAPPGVKPVLKPSGYASSPPRSEDVFLSLGVFFFPFPFPYIKRPMAIVKLSLTVEGVLHG